MDEHDHERTSGDPSAPDVEPRSYDPFDEGSRPAAPSWDSWSDPPSAFPDPSTQVFAPFAEDEPAPTNQGVTDPHPSPDASSPAAPAEVPEVDDEATQQWLAFSDDPDPGDSDAAELDGPNPEVAPPRIQPISPAAVSEASVDPSDAPTMVVDLAGPTLESATDAELDHSSAVLVPEVEVGQLIADRFRLEEQLAVRAGFLTWRAFDVKLSRPVLVHLLHKDDPRGESVLIAAREAATATDSAFLRVLDAATATDDIAYVVCEYVTGKSLQTLLAEGPLSGLEAAWVLREVARGMAPMHSRGLFHLRLNPDTVIISSTGNVRLVGFLIDAALTPTADDHLPKPQLQEADVHAMGQLLYAMLVSRWPVMPDETNDPQLRHFGLAPAPMDHEGWLTPRQVRAGVSPALDQVCDNVLHAQPRLGGVPLETAASIDEALERVLGTADASADLSQRVRQTVVPIERTGPVPARPPSVPDAALAAGSLHGPGDSSGDHQPRPAPVGATPEAPRERPPQRRIWLRVLLALIAVVLITSLVAVAIRQGRTPVAQPTPSTPAGPVIHPISKVDDFDPTSDNGNNEENPDLVANAWDKKPDTAWTTLTYLGNPKLGGLKPGVGLVIDLGQAVDVGTVKLTLVGQPTAVSIMVPSGDAATVTAAPMTGIKAWTPVATNGAATPNTTFTLKTKTTSRYLLVYLTSLPQVSAGKFRGGVAEIEVTS